MSNKNKIDNIINIKIKMENIFEEVGFKKEIVGDSIVYLNSKNHHYYRIDFVEGKLNSLVIETALCYEDAAKNIFEDDDLYPLSLGEMNILIKLKDDLKKYYI